MKIQGLRLAWTTACGTALCLLFAGFLATPAEAQVNVNVNIGAPPPVIVSASPTMVYLAEPEVFVAVGIPYDIYFIDGRYYYLRGDNWFWAAGYGGPWVHIVHHRLPPGLRKYKVVRLREFREREYKVYRVQGEKFRGKHFVAVADSHPGRGHGKKGKKD